MLCIRQQRERGQRGDIGALIEQHRIGHYGTCRDIPDAGVEAEPIPEIFIRLLGFPDAHHLRVYRVIERPSKRGRDEITHLGPLRLGHLLRDHRFDGTAARRSRAGEPPSQDAHVRADLRIVEGFEVGEQLGAGDVEREIPHARERYAISREIVQRGWQCEGAPIVRGHWSHGGVLRLERRTGDAQRGRAHLDIAREGLLTIQCRLNLNVGDQIIVEGNAAAEQHGDEHPKTDGRQQAPTTPQPHTSQSLPGEWRGAAAPPERTLGSPGRLTRSQPGSVTLVLSSGRGAHGKTFPQFRIAPSIMRQQRQKSPTCSGGTPTWGRTHGNTAVSTTQAATGTNWWSAVPSAWTAQSCSPAAKANTSRDMNAECSVPTAGIRPSREPQLPMRLGRLQVSPTARSHLGCALLRASLP